MSSEYEKKLIDMQYQMRENNAYLNDYLKDLDNWTNEMKTSEEKLKTTTSDPSKDELPPIRNFVPPKRTKKKVKKKSSAPIRSFDYRSWDKFDVEGECEKIDRESGNNADGEDEDELVDEEEDEKWQEQVLKQKGEHYKKWGNHHFEKKSYGEAIESYTKAIECDPTVAVYFANRAQCQLIEQRYGACESDCSLAIQLDQNYLKAYYRRALARIQLEKFERAREDLQFILQRDPTNKDAKTQLEQIDRSEQIKRLGRVYPLAEKPKQQRSTKPMKRIEIQEIDTSLITEQETISKKQRPIIIEEIQTPDATPTEPIVVAPNKEIPKTKQTEKPNSTSTIKTISAEKPIPTTGFQFKRDWASLSRNGEQQTIYFNRIPPSSYKNIFSTGIDASIFSRIIQIWSEKDVIDQHLIDSMYELRQTARFETQLSFLDSNEKKLLKSLLERFTADNLTQEKVQIILKEYRID